MMPDSSKTARGFDRFFGIAVVAAVVGLAGWAPGTLACEACASSPALHGGWERFREKSAALGDQPDIGVQLLYRVRKEDEKKPSLRKVSLSFWPRDKSEDAVYSIKPSEHLRMANAVEGAEVIKGVVSVDVTAMRPGVHHLEIHMAGKFEGALLEKTVLVPVPVTLPSTAPPAFASRTLPSIKSGPVE